MNKVQEVVQRQNDGELVPDSEIAEAMAQRLFLFECRDDGVRETQRMTWDEASRYTGENRLRIISARPI